MPYPDQFGFTYEDVGTLRIVDIAGHVPVHASKTYGKRHKYAIRKILVHHHAGAAKGTATRETTGAYVGVPKSCVQTAKFCVDPDDPNKPGVQGRDFPGYAYHHDIGYHDDTEAGRDIIFRTQASNVVSYHTGAGQNEMGISISHFGSLREQYNLKGQYNAPNDGKPSDFQKRCFPVVVDHLQSTYKVSDLHVQGHFQHKKPACPGWDTEFWIMHREERPRRTKRAFAWPVNPAGAMTPAFLEGVASKDLAAAKKLVQQAKDHASGFYPFGRTHLWHDGVHFSNAAAQPVFAVRDGWVVAARFDKDVKVKHKPGKDAAEVEIDYGSANFVLVLHEDPGLYDPLDARTYGESNTPRPLRYLALYMHVSRLTDATPWVKLLKERDPDRWKKIEAAPEKVYNLSGVALPVRAGEVVGAMGKHNPFAARPATAPAPVNAATYSNAANNFVVHFELFSEENLLERFDPDKNLHKKWTLTDADKNILAEDIVNKLGKLDGVTTADIDDLKAAIKAADAADPTQNDASAWAQHLTPKLNNALSKVVVKHASEWHADWDAVINARYKAWGLDVAGRDHLKKVIAEFKWYKDAFKADSLTTDSIRTSHTGKLAGLPATGAAFHYHPIRLLMWLGSLARTLDHAPTGGIDASGYPISTNVYADIPTTITVLAAAAAGAKEVSLPKATAEDRLRNSSIRFAGHSTVYEVESHAKSPSDKTFTSWKVTLKAPLEKDVAKSAKAKLGNYGWHFEAGFNWADDLV